MGFAATRFMRPGNLAKQVCEQAAFKLFTFGLVLFIATLVSVFITGQIDNTYQESISATMQTAQDVAEAIQTTADEVERKDPENPIEFLLQTLGDLQASVDSVSQSAANAVERVKNLLGSLVEAFAVMLVPSIVIPAIVPIVICLAFKLLCDQQLIVLQQDSSHVLPPAE